MKTRLLSYELLRTWMSACTCRQCPTRHYWLAEFTAGELHVYAFWQSLN